MASTPPARPLSRSVSSTSLPARRATPVAELSPEQKRKELLVASACKDGDTTTLTSLATSLHGLVSDNLRCKAWPLLLGCSDDNEENTLWKELLKHKDEHQVDLDVNRAFVYYPKNESEKQLDGRKKDLGDVIIRVLRQHPMLCYFQGYHDIVQVFLLVLGAQNAPAAVARLSLLRIRDFMLSSIDSALSQLDLLRPILNAADPVLYKHLPKRPPSFALANTITMFAHNIQDYRDITRLFDFFLASHAVMPIYLFAAVVLSNREQLLELDEDDEDVMYVMLSKIPQPFDVEFHIARTLELYERLPPASLRGWEWWRISSSSVLKASATNTDLHCQTLEDGEKFFEQQEAELEWKRGQKRAQDNMKLLWKKLWYYRRYSALGLAVLFGAYSIWLGRTGQFPNWFRPKRWIGGR